MEGGDASSGTIKLTPWYCLHQTCRHRFATVFPEAVQFEGQIWQDGVQHARRIDWSHTSLPGLLSH